jgi:hypothetical protein
LSPAAAPATCSHFYQDIADATLDFDKNYIYELWHKVNAAKVEYLEKVLDSEPALYPTIVDRYRDLLQKITPCRDGNLTSNTCRSGFLNLIASQMSYGFDFPGLNTRHYIPTGVDQEIDRLFFGNDSNLRRDILGQIILGPQQMIVRSTSYVSSELLQIIDSISRGQISNEELNSELAEAKKYVLNVLATMPIEDSVKSRIKPLINNVHLNYYPTNCSSHHLSYDEESEGAQLNRVFSSIEMCGRFMSKRFSKGARFFVLAHEIAHSFDPCQIGFDFSHAADQNIFPFATNLFSNEKLPTIYDFRKNDSVSPYRNLLKCLRSENSVRARPAIEYASAPDQTTSSDPNAPQQVVIRAERRDPLTFVYLCGIKKFDGLLPRDSITEAFADWISAQAEVERYKDQPQISVASDLIDFNRMLAPSRKSVIIDNRMNRFSDPHPNVERLIQNIFLANPIIRKAVQCTEDNSTPPLYCDGSDQHLHYPDFLSDFIPNGQFLSQ